RSLLHIGRLGLCPREREVRREERRRRRADQQRDGGGHQQLNEREAGVAHQPAVRVRRVTRCTSAISRRRSTTRTSMTSVSGEPAAVPTRQRLTNRAALAAVASLPTQRPCTSR